VTGVGEIVGLAFGLLPIDGCQQDAIEEQQGIAIFAQQLGKHRPVPQQRLMRDFKSPQGGHTVSSRRKLCDQKPALRQRVRQRGEIGWQVVIARDASLWRFALAIDAGQAWDKQTAQQLAAAGVIGGAPASSSAASAADWIAAATPPVCSSSRSPMVLPHMLMHQTLHDKGEQWQRVRFAGDLGLQPLDHRGVEYGSDWPGLAAKDLARSRSHAQLALWDRPRLSETW